jgi:hypothetical protein
MLLPDDRKIKKKKCIRCGVRKLPPCCYDIHHVLGTDGKRNGAVMVLCAICHRKEHRGGNGQEPLSPKPFREKIEIPICPTCGNPMKFWSCPKFSIGKVGICQECWLAMDSNTYHGPLAQGMTLDELARKPLSWENDMRDLWLVDNLKYDVIEKKPGGRKKGI